MSERVNAPSLATTTIALRFVADLQSGHRPSIEAALDTVPTTEWPTLLQSLLIAEVNSRRARGEQPLIREYLPRFPAHREIVCSVLPEIPVAKLVPIVEPLDPEPAPASMARTVIPSATAAMAPVPVAIALPRAFEDFEETSVPAPNRRRRRTLKWLVAGGCALTLVLVGLIVLKYTWKPKVEQSPGGPEPKGPITSSTTSRASGTVEPKVAPAFEGERGLAEWVQKLGGNGTIAMDAGGRRPFGPETPLPKANFAVATFAIPAVNPPRWTANDLNGLRGRAKLISVQLAHPTALTDAALEPLVDLPLQTLDLRGTNVQVTGAFLARFPALTSIALMSAPAFADADLKELAKLTKLDSLALDTPKLTTDGFKALKALPIRSLSFGASVKLGPDEMREFQGLPLEDFDAAGPISDEAFLEFAVVQSLKRIRLRNAKLTDAGLKTVSGLGKLEELHIVGASLTPAGIEHLSERKGLKILDLSRSNINTDAVEKILVLPALKEIYLAGCPVDDLGANFLANLDGIEVLDLSDTRITDKAMDSLTKHATLKSLVLTGTKVSQQAIREFERATPQCKVTVAARK